MGYELRAPTEDDLPAMFRADGRAFGFTYEDNDIEEMRGVLDLERFRIVLDGEDVVGVGGTFAFDVTLPGGAAVPMGGVTWISTAATHRRRGVLSAMMDALHEDMVDRGDVMGGLTASEGGIYERFGYGIASPQRLVAIDRVRARMRPDVVPAGDVSYVAPERVRDVMVAHWDRYRRTCPGELSRSDAWTDRLVTLRNRAAQGSSAAFVLEHPDGYASYRIKEEWNDGRPAHRLDVMEVVACTPDAHAALWSVLLAVDLVGTVAKRGLAMDDPLPLLLTDPRLVRTTDLNDGLWLRPVDAMTVLGARTYGTTDRLVVAIQDTGERIAVEGSPDGAQARRVRARPDLTCTRAALGALVLGGVRASYLAAGGRVVEERPGVLRRADAFFLGERLPLLQTGF